MLVLGIETTCDETAAAVVKDGQEILSNVIHSQIDLHKKYGGVFPEHASRRHSEAIIPVIEEALHKTGLTAKEIDLIAVAKGPGLIGPLLIGLNTAKSLSLAWNIPYIGINHVEAHLYAAMMGQPSELVNNSLGVVLSGGHTFMVLINSVGSYQRIGSTVDDAIGEAFDKVATLLGFAYPGGAAIEKLASLGVPTLFPFNCGKVKRSPFDFSFSGLKTSVLYTLKGKSANREAPNLMSEEDKKHIAASFQETAFNDVICKCLLAIEKFNLKALFLGGGVCQNNRLRELCSEKINLPIFWPSKELCTDNAAMIAGLGFHQFQAKPMSDPLDLQPQTRMPL